MPAYETDLCNIALARIGIARIGSIDDTTVQAKWCKTLLPTIRQTCLTMDWWSFADKRVQLAQDATAPAFEFSYRYLLPSDFLRLHEYNGANIDVSALDPIYRVWLLSRFKIEGSYVFTNDGEVKIVYTYDNNNPSTWSPQFLKLVATMLASELAAAINKNDKQRGSLESEALMTFLPLAAAIDSQQRESVKRYQVDDLLWGRDSG